MSYFTGALAAVPSANKDKYLHHAKAAWPLFRSYGALRMVETWGSDVPSGKITDFYQAVAAQDDETVVFSWMEWPDKATADASWQKMENDPAMRDLPEMPFDGSRMIFGGFSPLFSAGDTPDTGYYQGFLLAVPEDNKSQYEAMIEPIWQMFQSGGASSITEAWGTDIPKGKQTDFFRATKAQDGEVPVIGWTTWPDRETYLQAIKLMDEKQDAPDIPDMPFDGMRMMWGGFEPLLDCSARS